MQHLPLPLLPFTPASALSISPSPTFPLSPLCFSPPFPSHFPTPPCLISFLLSPSLCPLSTLSLLLLPLCLSFPFTVSPHSTFPIQFSVSFPFSPLPSLSPLSLSLLLLSVSLSPSPSVLILLFPFNSRSLYPSFLSPRCFFFLSPSPPPAIPHLDRP